MIGFSDKKLSSVYRALINSLTAASIDSAQKEARIILTQRTPYDWGSLVSNGDVDLSDEQFNLICSDLESRLNGVPLSRLYGEREFWGLNFLLSPETLDPRPDTETIIDIAKRRFEKKEPEMILDLGTGSGCILISLLSEFKASRGVGIDLSLGAVNMARENAKKNNCADRSMFYCGDWARALNEKFDLVVSNPPYISNQIIPTLSLEVRNHDPILALDGGNDGLIAYRQIFSSLKNLLNLSGIALFEIGYDQEETVSRLAVDYGFLVHGVHPDLAGQPRVVDMSSGDK